MMTDIRPGWGGFWRLMCGTGDPCIFGCEEDDVGRVIAFAKKRYPDKPYCIVSHWSWADIDITDIQAQTLVFTKKVYPACIYSDWIVEDQARRFEHRGYVRSGLLYEFHLPALFVTRNTAYILSGPGKRLMISVDTFTSFNR